MLFKDLLEHSFSRILACGLGSTLLLVIFTLLKMIAPSIEVPWVGGEKMFLSRTLANIRSVTAFRANMDKAWDHFFKLNEACVIPSNFGEHVVLPASFLPWLVSQPESTLSSKILRKESLAMDYTLLDPLIGANPTHQLIVRKELRTKLHLLAPDLIDEIAATFDQEWGTDTENWNDIVVHKTVRQVVARASNRIYVGLPLCRNNDYIRNAEGFATDIAITGNVIRLFPFFLKPIIGRLATLPNLYHAFKCKQFLYPLLGKRLAEWKVQKANGAELPPSEREDSTDFAKWFVHSVKSQDPDNRENLWRLSLRLLALNFASIHTSTLSGTNLFHDLFSPPTTAEALSILRTEAEGILRLGSTSDQSDQLRWGVESLPRLPDMPYLDSAFRESLRIYSFATLGLSRTVAVPSGIDLPSLSGREGARPFHLPRGTRVSIAAYSAHHDPAVYDSPWEYQPFRFLAPTKHSSETSDPSGAKVRSDKVATGDRGPPTLKAAVTTEQSFLTFGHGKGACPGRWFAVLLEKLMVAYVLVNYEVQMHEKRPESHWFAEMTTPNHNATLRIRRRKFEELAEEVKD